MQGKLKFSKKNQSYLYFDIRVFHMGCPGRESAPSQSEIGDYPPSLTQRLNKCNKETRLKLCKIMGVTTFFYGCENWTLLQQHDRRTDIGIFEVSCRIYMTTKQTNKGIIKLII
jgi:hypothetical protein